MARITDPRLNNFKNVVHISWEELGIPPPTPVQYEVAQRIQHGPQRLFINGFRGLAKSWLASVYVMDALRHIPSLNILVVSATKTRADDFTAFCLRLTSTVSIFESLHPDKEQRATRSSFDVKNAPPAQAPSVKAVGIGGQITGYRADIVILDDIESSNNSLTLSARERLVLSSQEFESVLKPVPNDIEIKRLAPDLPLDLARKYFGRILVIGTQQTYDSYYNTLPDRGFTRITFPVIVPAKDIYDGTLDEFYRGKEPGTSIDPTRFSIEDLRKREISSGKSYFSLQFLLDTNLTDATKYPLKLRDLIVFDTENQRAYDKITWKDSPVDLPMVGFPGDCYNSGESSGSLGPYTHSVLAVDPAGTGANQTAVTVLKAHNGLAYLLESKGLSGGYSNSALEEIANLAKHYKVKKILVESNFGNGMYASLLQPVLTRIYPCQIEEVTNTKSKEQRIIDVLEPIMNSHKLVVSKELIERDADVGDLPMYSSLFYQISRITKDKGSLPLDDKIDSLALAIDNLKEVISIDPDLKAKRQNELLLKNRTQSFFNRPASKTWIHTKQSPRKNPGLR